MEPLTPGDHLLGALERAGYNIEKADQAKLEDLLHGVNTNVVEWISPFVEKNFPRNSMTLRAAEGPLLQFLKNAAGDEMLALDNAEHALLEWVASALDAAAKAEGA